MNYPWCKVCEKFDAASQACTESVCKWTPWAQDIVVDRSRISSGGTGVGFPAIIGGKVGWMKAQEKGKTGGYSWEQTRKAFSYEVNALRYLESMGNTFVPHVLADDQEGDVDGAQWVYYGMSIAEGVDIDRVSSGETKKALFGLCEALLSLHRCGFGHFDLKPQNIIYNSRSGKVTLIDLGSSKGPDAWRMKSEKNRNHPIIEGNRPGTFPYVSPEHQTQRLINLTLASDDYVYGILFCQAILGRIVEKTENRAAIQQLLIKKGVDGEIAECVAWRLLSEETAGRRNALEALFGMLIRHDWNEGRLSTLRPVQAPLPRLLQEAMVAAQTARRSTPTSVRKSGGGMGKKILIGLGVVAIALASYFAGGGGKTQQSAEDASFFPRNAGGGMGGGSRVSGGGVASRPNNGRPSRPQPKGTDEVLASPTSAIKKTEAREAQERILSYCEVCGEELVRGECKKPWLHTPEYTDLWQACIDNYQELRDFTEVKDKLTADFREDEKKLKEVQELYQELSQTSEQVQKEITALELKMAASDEALDAAYSRNRKEKSDESRKAFEEAQAENDRIIEALQDAKKQLTRAGSGGGQELAAAKEQLAAVQKAFDEKKKELDGVNLRYDEATRNMQSLSERVKTTAAGLEKAHNEELIRANQALAVEWKEEMSKLLAEGAIEELKDQLRRGVGDGQEWKRAESVEFYRANKERLMPKVFLTDAPKGASVRLNNAGDWIAVGADGRVMYDLPKDWNGRNLELTVSCMVGDCPVCSDVKEVGFTGDQAINFFTGDRTETFPAISLKNDPTYKIEVTPFDAKVLCKVEGEEEKEITMGQLFSIPAHEKFSITAQKDGYVEEQFSGTAEHRGTQGKVLERMVLKEGRSEIVVMRGGEPADGGADYAYGVDVKTIFIVDKDKKYTDAEIMGRVGDVKGMAIVHLNGAKQETFASPIDGFIEGGQFEVHQPISGVTFGVRAREKGFEWSVNAAGLKEGSCFIVDRIHYFTVNNFQNLLDSWLLNEQYPAIIKLLEAQRTGKKAGFSKVAASFFEENAELHPTYTIRPSGNVPIFLEKTEANRDELNRVADWVYAPKLKLGEERDVKLRIYRVCNQCGKECSEEKEMTFRIKWNDRGVLKQLSENEIPKYKADPVVYLPKNAVAENPTVKLGIEAITDWVEEGKSFRVEPHNKNLQLSFTFDRFEEVKGVMIPSMIRGESTSLPDIALVPKKLKTQLIFNLEKALKDKDVSIYVRNKGGEYKTKVIQRGNVSQVFTFVDGLTEGELEYGYSLNALPSSSVQTIGIQKGEQKSISITHMELGIFPKQKVPEKSDLAMVIRTICAKNIVMERDGSESQAAADWFKTEWRNDPKVGANIKVLIEHIKSSPECTVSLCNDVRTANIQRMTDDEIFGRIADWCKRQTNRSTAISNSAHNEDE